jgi:hypothetical protein
MAHAPRRNDEGANDNTGAGSSAAGEHVSHQRVCDNCQKPPAAGNKMQACGRCRAATFCSEACQREAWPEHKLVCERARAARERTLADFANDSESGVSGRARVKRVKEHFGKVVQTPGLQHKVQFLAWKHRSETPIIESQTLVDNAEHVTVVQMLPRTVWDHANNMELNSYMVTAARDHLASSAFDAGRAFLHLIRVIDASCGGSSIEFLGPSTQEIHSSALMTLTADDFAAEMLRRKNNPRKDAVFVRLTGLVGAAHLNGREGVLTGRDPNNSERFGVSLVGDDKDISVRSVNYETVRRHWKVFNGEF